MHFFSLLSVSRVKYISLLQWLSFCRVNNNMTFLFLFKISFFYEQTLSEQQIFSIFLALWGQWLFCSLILDDIACFFSKFHRCCLKINELRVVYSKTLYLKVSCFVWYRVEIHKFNKFQEDTRILRANTVIIALPWIQIINTSTFHYNIPSSAGKLTSCKTYPWSQKTACSGVLSWKTSFDWPCYILKC